MFVNEASGLFLYSKKFIPKYFGNFLFNLDSIYKPNPISSFPVFVYCLQVHGYFYTQLELDFFKSSCTRVNPVLKYMIIIAKIQSEIKLEMFHLILKNSKYYIWNEKKLYLKLEIFPNFKLNVSNKLSDWLEPTILLDCSHPMASYFVSFEYSEIVKNM